MILPRWCQGCRDANWTGIVAVLKTMGEIQVPNQIPQLKKQIKVLTQIFFSSKPASSQRIK